MTDPANSVPAPGDAPFASCSEWPEGDAAEGVGGGAKPQAASTAEPAKPQDVGPAWWGPVGVVVMVAIVVVVYAGSFGVPFIFDDFTIINNNRFMRSLWPPMAAMEAPWRSTAAGRPLVAYSFAVNYAISGLEVWSYHVFNLLVHLVNVLLVYGIARRVQGQALFAQRSAGRFTHRTWALLLAGLWAIHPLNSETVVYIAQRTELMMAAFFLAAFVTLPRGGREGTGPIYTLVTVVLGLLAVLCKETAAVLPVLLLLFDRAFIGGSFAAAWRERKGVYLGGVAIIAVAAVIASGDHRGGLVTDDASVTWRYLLTQGGVILHYLRLSVVPYPLAITYGWPLVEGLRDGWLAAGVVGVGLLLTCWALVRRPMLGFLGAAFYLLLAPTSSVIPIMSEVAGERRMYLPLLVVLMLLAVAVAAIVGRVMASDSASRQRAGAAGMGFVLCAVCAGAAVTVVRVQDFRSTESIWRQTLRVEPESLYAKSNLAVEMIAQRRLDEAERMLLDIKVVEPGFPQLDVQMGLVAFRRGDFAAAAEFYLAQARSPRGKPRDYAYAGYSLMRDGQNDAGQRALGEALSLDPDNPEALNFVGSLLSAGGRYEEALTYTRRVLEMFPEKTPVWANQAHHLFKLGDLDAARAAYQEALRLEAENVGVIRNFANFEASVKNYPAAINLCQRWVSLEPNALSPLKLYVKILVESAQDEAAAGVFLRLVTLYPRDVDTRQRYALWLGHTGDLEAADRHLAVALRLEPDNARTADIAEKLEGLKQGRAAQPRGAEPAAASSMPLRESAEPTDASPAP